MAASLDIGPLDHRITIEKKVVTQDPDYGTEIVTWTPVATVWANIEDVLPTRSEAYRNRIAVSTDQIIIRFRYRTDIDSSMHIIAWRPNRNVYEIVSGPAEIGRHQYLEIGCERYSS